MAVTIIIDNLKKNQAIREVKRIGREQRALPVPAYTRWYFEEYRPANADRMRTYYRVAVER